MIYQCQRSSHSGNNIDDVFVFDNLFLDGVKLETKLSIRYVYEERNR